jgi:hypothetical protein
VTVSVKAYGGRPVQRLGSLRPAATRSNGLLEQYHPESAAAMWWLGVDGVMLDESRIWKSCGGTWQVTPEASGL